MKAELASGYILLWIEKPREASSKENQECSLKLLQANKKSVVSKGPWASLKLVRFCCLHMSDTSLHRLKIQLLCLCQSWLTRSGGSVSANDIFKQAQSERNDTKRGGGEAKSKDAKNSVNSKGHVLPIQMHPIILNGNHMHTSMGKTKKPHHQLVSISMVTPQWDQVNLHQLRIWPSGPKVGSELSSENAPAVAFLLYR